MKQALMTSAIFLALSSTVYAQTAQTQAPVQSPAEYAADEDGDGTAQASVPNNQSNAFPISAEAKIPASIICYEDSERETGIRIFDAEELRLEVDTIKNTISAKVQGGWSGRDLGTRSCQVEATKGPIQYKITSKDNEGKLTDELVLSMDGLLPEFDAKKSFRSGAPSRATLRYDNATTNTSTYNTYFLNCFRR